MAAVWDEEWDKFGDSGFSNRRGEPIVKESPPVVKGSRLSTDGAPTAASTEKEDNKIEKSAVAELTAEPDSAPSHGKVESAKIPSTSSGKSAKTDAKGHLIEPSDLSTRLPPRKRLLAGFRTASTACDVEPLPITFVSGNLGVRLRDMVSSANSSPEEIVEAARSAASAAAEAALAARAAAAEKAAIAIKAKATARRALEFVDSHSRRSAPRNGHQVKAKSKKKHVQVKLLYKSNGLIDGKGNKEEALAPCKGKETDEELARKLHRAMNSSPRISSNGPKRPRIGGGRKGISSARDDACNGSKSHLSVKAGELTNGCSTDRSSEKTFLCSKPDTLEDGEDSPKHTGKRQAISGVGIGNFTGGWKAKIKRKKLLLNQYNSRESPDPEEAEPSVDSAAFDESKSNGIEKQASLTDTKTMGDGLVPMKITSVWKFKKFKASHSSSHSKVLHTVHSSSSVAGTSASVKAD